MPTNGKGPHPAAEPDTAPPADDDAPPRASSTVGFTPTQLAVGFGIIASLVLLAAGADRPATRSRAPDDVDRAAGHEPADAAGGVRGARRGADPPVAGGTDLMVALTGELGEPPERVLDLWRLDELRGIVARRRRARRSER